MGEPFVEHTLGCKCVCSGYGHCTLCDMFGCYHPPKDSGRQLTLDEALREQESRKVEQFFGGNLT